MAQVERPNMAEASSTEAASGTISQARSSSGDYGAEGGATNRSITSPSQKHNRWAFLHRLRGAQAIASSEQRSRNLNPQARADINQALANAGADSLGKAAPQDILEKPRSIQRQKPPEEEVKANAKIEDDNERLQKAQELVDVQLLDKLGKPTLQGQAVLNAHRIGSETGSIYNYSFGQIREKTKILAEVGFSEEQRRTILESGIAGFLPSSEFNTFNAGDYDDPKLKRIAERIKDAGDKGKVDEVLIYRTIAQIRKLDEAAEIESIEAERLLDQLEDWRSKADDTLLPYSERSRIEQAVDREGRPHTRSDFNIIKEYYEYYSSIDINTIPANLRTELQSRTGFFRGEIQRLVNEARVDGIFVDFDKRVLAFYDQVKTARRKEKYSGREKQTIIDSARHGYPELFWKDSPRVKELEKRFAGVAAYVWDGIVSEVNKEANGESSVAYNVVADAEFNRLKQRRSNARDKEKKYEPNLYFGQLNYELTAENGEELAPAVLDFIGDQIAELSRDPTMAGGQIDQLRQKVLQMLETNRFFLEKEEGQDLAPTHPDFLRARNIAEAVTDVLANELMLYKGQEEAGPQYKKRFASEFIAHHDAIYLENPYVAYILHKLTTHRDGTYWLGQPLDSEKLQEGEIADYRRMIEQEIIEDASAHELFITEEDFRRRKIVGSNGKERDLTYSFDDNIEKLLLDPDGSVWKAMETKLHDQGRSQAEINRAQARHDVRVKVFRDIKERLDTEENLVLTSRERQQLEQQKGAPLTVEELVLAAKNKRELGIRTRIIQQMQKQSRYSYLARSAQEAMAKMRVARAAGNTPEYDSILWKWVEDYNQYRIKMRLPRWQPSGWDRVRMRIDRPTKVLDRALSEEQLEAMFEPVVLPNTFDYDQVETRKRIDSVRFGFQLARSYQIFTMQDTLLGGMRTRLIDINTGQYTGRLMDDEASRLLGLIDQNGSVVNPTRKLVRVFDIVQARIEAAITEEAQVIEQAKREKAIAIASGNQDLVKEKTQVLRNMLVNAQFLATHALKAKGLVEGKLPVWSYNFLDDSTLDVFMNALADYGVETAENVPISHEDKGLFYEIVERGRRGLKSEWDRATQEHMATSYKVLARNPDGSLRAEQAKSLWRVADEYGGEKGKDITSRYRMVNKGAVDLDRRVTDTRLEISTSGGVAVAELIPDLGDLGFYPLLVWMGVTDVRSFHGYIHRRDETEFHRHKFFHTMDPVQHADSLGAAYKAIKALTGGKIDEGKTSPGILKEPFHGGFKSADWLAEQHQYAQQHKMEAMDKYLTLMQEYRYQSSSYSEFLDKWSGEIKVVNEKGGVEIVKITGRDLEKYRQMTYLDLDKLDKKTADAFYMTMYGVYDYFQDFLKALKPVEAGRRGRAPRNWEENNHKKFYALRREMRASMQGKKDASGAWIKKPEHGFIMRLGYSPEVASEAAIRMLEVVLLDADYLILRGYEVSRRVKDGVDILDSALTLQERQTGFVIPNQKDWPALRPELQKALKTIRRRGLLEFMVEEGYTLGSKEILGQKVPPYVQEKMVKEDKSGKLIASLKP